MPIFRPKTVPAVAPDVPDAPTPAVAQRHWLRWMVGLVVFIGVVGGGAWAYLLVEIVPNIDRWRAPLVKQASTTLGTPVRIAQIRGRSVGLWPEVTLEGIDLLDAQGQVGLRLPSVTARLSPATLWPTSLWRGEVQIDRLVLLEPQLHIRRDVRGGLHVAGLALDGMTGTSDTSTSSALDWLLDQERVGIVRGRIVWTDELRHAPSLALTDVDLTLRNRQRLTQRVHDWSLAATPPASFGGRMRLQARLSQPYWGLKAFNSPSLGAAEWLAGLGGSARAGDWRRWSGLVQLDLPQADVQSLRQHASLPFDIQGGHGRVRLDLVLKEGQAQQMLLETDVRDVSVRLGRDLQPLAFTRLAGKASVRLDDGEAELSLQGLSFQTSEGLSWPTSRARWLWRHAPIRTASVPGSLPLLPDLSALEAAPGLQGEFDTDQLDVALLARLADRVPLPKPWRAALENLAPTGLGRQLKATWSGSMLAPQRYQLSGRFERLGWQSFDGRPGVSGASISLKADQAGGRAEVAMTHGWLEFPGAFDEPRIPVDTLRSDVAWHFTQDGVSGSPPGLRVQVNRASFANADLDGQLQATWTTGRSGDHPEGRFPGHLDLQGHLNRGQGARVWRYLPAAIAVSARHYVRDAVRSGVGEQVQFEVLGPLEKFPFNQAGEGRFLIKVPVKDAVLDYVPAQDLPSAPFWPAFSNLQGTLVFDRTSLRIESASALLGGVGTGRFVLKQVQGSIADMGSAQPVLKIRGQGEGPLSDLLKYVTLSPINAWTDKVLDDAKGTGSGELDLELTIPLQAPEQSRVQGKITLQDKHLAALRMSPDLPLLQGLRGQILFTEQGLKVAAKGRALGQELQINGSSSPQNLPKFTVGGVLNAEALRAQTDAPVLARLAQHLSGQTPIQLTVALTRVRPPTGASPSGANAGPAGSNTRPEIQFVSTLQGLGLKLPAPFNKDPNAAWPVKWLKRGDDAEGRKDLMQLDLTAPGLTLHGDYRRSDTESTRQVNRGVFSLVQGPNAAAAALPLPTSGVVGRVNLASLDVDAWQSLIQAWVGNDEPGPSNANGPQTPPAAAGLEQAWQGYFPQNLQIRLGAVSWQRRTVNDLSATVQHPDPRTWKVQVDSAPVAGTVEWRPEDGEGQRIVARLKRLQVPASEVARLQARASQPWKAGGVAAPGTGVPSLDIVVDELDWRGLALGRLELQASNRVVRNAGSAPQPEWRLSTFKLSNADAQLKASGNWLALGAQQDAGMPTGAARDRAAFSFTLDLNNSGALLARLGQPQTLKGGNGKITGHVAWPGSPLSPDVGQLTGDMQVALSEGQFLKVEPGVGRLLGVLSLQALPRRFLLDFRDVFQTGFAFDRIDGDVTMAQGVASTRNLRMRGVQAVVLMEGVADLKQETQNLRVFVVPEINAGTASLAYAAINPAIGLGTFIAQMLLRQTVIDAGTREFTVTGSWADPLVEKVVRTAASSPVPSPDDAPAPPSSPVSTAPSASEGRPALKASRTPF